MNSPTDDSGNECKLVPSPCFLTVTLDDRNQRVSQCADASTKVNYRRRHLNRLVQATNLINNVVIPAVDDFMSEYTLVTEISEALQSKGKYYPRIHFHILGELTCPISFLMHMGDFFHAGLGYHIICNLNTEQYNKRVDYIKKQQQYWRMFLRKRNYITIKLVHNSGQPKRKGRRERRSRRSSSPVADVESVRTSSSSHSER